MMTGRLRKTRGVDGRTGPEIEAEETDKRIAQTVDRLERDFGISKEMRHQLSDVRMNLAKLDGCCD